MNAKMRKVKRFVMEHKKELAIAAVTITGGAIVFAITRKKSDKVTKAMEHSHKAVEATIEKWRDVDASAINMGSIVNCDTNGSWIDVMVDDITVSDLGKFGEELVKLETVNPDTEVSALISLIKDVKVETF